MKSDPFGDFLQVGGMLIIVFLAILASVGISGVVLYGLVLWLRWRGREERSLDYVLLSVAVPRDNEIKIDAAEQMFTSLYSLGKGGGFAFLKPQDYISFEMVGLPEDIRFYISCPAPLRDFIERQVYGAYPGAEVAEVPEYNIFSEKGKVAFTRLKLRGADYYPLRTYKDLPVDSLSAITTALGKMQPGEGAAIQILVAPADNKWRTKGKSYVSKLRSEEVAPERPKPADPKMIEGVEAKCAKPGFNVLIRVVVSAKDLPTARAHLKNITASFAQFNNPLLNSFTKANPRIKKAFMINFIYRYLPVLGRPSVLNSEELAGIFHFPNKSVETPHIFWLNARRAPASGQIASSGTYIGQNIYRGTAKPICLSERDRRQHVYIVGKTGVGKTELLKNMVLQDIRKGRGVIVIDPHDAIDSILEQIPPERAEEVILFDPADSERPIGLNMLEAYTEEQKHFLTSSIIGLMYKLFDPHQTGIIGPRFEHAIRNAMLTVMGKPGTTFIEVVRCLTDSSFVREMLPYVTDPIVRRYWTDQIAQTSDFHKSEVLDYIVSKFGRFVTNKLIRNIIGQSKSAFDFRKVMDGKKILLLKLSKGKIGEENSIFLGLVLIPKILLGAMSRQDIPEEQRIDCYLYVDEFQNFATPDFAQILSEARKYHLNLTVANQFIGQMEEDIKNAVFGNVGTIVALRTGVTDANYLQHEFQPTFNELDLINVEKYNAYVKTLVHNEPLLPFSVNMYRDLSHDRHNPKLAEMIRELSRLRFGRAKAVVEAELAVRAKL
jgi:hypothetical protein